MTSLPLLLYYLSSVLLVYVDSIDLTQVVAEREKILVDEDQRFLGGTLMLNSAEQLANIVLMKRKTDEYDRAFISGNFVPANHFFQAKPKMLQSQVYQFIRSLPKGGALHIHDIAITPIEFLIEDASYRPGLYVCTPLQDPVFFKYSSTIPSDLQDCKWESVAARRTQEGTDRFDAWLRSKFSLYTPKPQETYPTINDVWAAFENSLIAASGIITHAPVFVDYLYQGLQSFYEDNVQYMEIRTTLPKVYLLNGTLLDERQVTALYQETFDRFRRDHPDFSGAKIIFAPLRRVDNVTITRYISLTSELKREFPETVAGFDLVGQEDFGPPLKNFLAHLVTGLTEDPALQFFFHAGETDWLGTQVDENLIDAILLNATRIGHGFAIAKHPSVMELARARRIPIEVCPLSNQVLALVDDLRNHPASALFSTDFPLVISSDDPASWETFGLSSDYYMAFMGLAGRRADLRTLKQLAINSILFSAMDSNEKNAAMVEWQRRWDTFIQNIIKED